jgi:hypothetical protein
MFFFYVAEERVWSATVRRAGEGTAYLFSASKQV